ncbi:ROK family protein [Luethyella okanaganae]|uniref:ROK family protein n=1 Tax=Luethyella okanaganae TaxID=69372 RepID=A0ABW1VGF5_9MICO
MSIRPEHRQASPVGVGETVVAFDVGGTDMKSALFDTHGTLLGLRRTSTPLSGEHTAEAVLDRVAEITADYAREFPGVVPRAAGLLVPGLVDDDRGIGVLASNLGWRDVPFKRLAEERLGVPVAFSHDVRGAGEAEFRLGAARPFTDVAIMVIGTGIAGAIFVDGHPHLAGGFAGEIGHSIVIPDGPLCACGGRGHLEAIASAGAIARRYNERTGLAVDGSRDVLARAQAGDEIAGAVWREAIEALALSISQLVALLAPDAVVIGGGLAQAGPALFDPLIAELERLLTFHRRPRLVPAQIGENAGLIGAALRARDLVVNGAPADRPVAS